MNLSIVSYLDPSTTTKVRELQRALSEITGSKASLLSWEPHVTIGDGISVTGDQINEVKTEFDDVATATKAFELTISGFGGMDSRPIGIDEISTPYVIWVDIAANQALIDLVAKVKTITTNQSKWYHMPDPFLPHITLAFRDLSKEGYEKGLEYLKNKQFEATAIIDHLALVEKQDSTDVEYTRFIFKD